MEEETLYLKIEQNVQVNNKRVCLRDIAKFYCNDKKIMEDLNKEVLTVIRSKEDVTYAFSILKVIEIIHKTYPNLKIVNLGEVDFVLTYKQPKVMHKWFEYAKCVFISLAIFFGAAFTIMTFNTDVSVDAVFDKFYELVMGSTKEGGSILEVSYAIGLPIGIIVFFNHFSRAKIHNDPTPLQIQMRSYEDDVISTIIQNSSREGKEIDVD